MTATGVKWLEIFMWVMNFSRDQYIIDWWMVFYSLSLSAGWRIVWRKNYTHHLEWWSETDSFTKVIHRHKFTLSWCCTCCLLLLQYVLWLAGCCDLINYRVDLVVGTWIQFIFPFFKIRCYHWIDLLDEVSRAVSVPSCYYTGIKWCFPGEYVMHSTRVTVVVMNHHELGHHQLCISFDDALLWYIAWPLLVGSTHSIGKSSKQKGSF